MYKVWTKNYSTLYFTIYARTLFINSHANKIIGTRTNDNALLTDQGTDPKDHHRIAEADTIQQGGSEFDAARY